MKNRQIIAIIIVLVIVLGLIRFSGYTSTVTISTYENNESTADNSKKANRDVNLENFTININPQENKSDSSAPETIKADVKLKYETDSDVGLGRFVPYYKHINFNSYVNYFWEARIWNGKKFSNIHGQNNFSMRGVKTIKGTCTPNRAKKSIISDIRNEAIKNIKKSIEDKIIEIQHQNLSTR